MESFLCKEKVMEQEKTAVLSSSSDFYDSLKSMNHGLHILQTIFFINHVEIQLFFISHATLL